MDNQPVSSGGALSGLRVVDLTRVLAGPLCTQYLGDHGAEIIKIEPPQGDETRDWGPISEEGSAYYNGINRNKLHASLNLSSKEGRDVLLRLLDISDVLIDNFKSGTLERWGIGYEQTLRQRFPRLIYCQITGFGDDGPLGGLPGYDSVVQAMAGCMSVNGEANGGPMRVGMSLVDIGTALNAVAGIMMAVFERTGSGKGQKVDVALYDCAMVYLHPHAAGLLQAGVVPGRTGNAHPSIAPYEMFETRTGPLFLGIGNDSQFARLCQHLGRPDLISKAEFHTNVARVAHRQELRAILVPLLLSHDSSELSGDLLAYGVPAAEVLTVGEVLAAPHTVHREMVVERPGYTAVGIPLKLSRTPGSIRSLPKKLGTDTRAVCTLAGLKESDIDALLGKQAIPKK